jgi:uncharacterized membrane protein (UPF0127 family)
LFLPLAYVGGFVVVMKYRISSLEAALKKYRSAYCVVGCALFFFLHFLENSPQVLPISASTTIANQHINLEVARTLHQKEKGLMYRTSLAADRGMLFVYEPPQIVGFWMRNMKIPLDMVFLRDGRVKLLKENVLPCSTNSCPIYETDIAIDQVVELRAGRAAQLGLKVGDRVNIKFFNGATHE